MTTQQRSIVLRNFSAATLGNQTYSKGEVFYDETYDTLRVYDGKVKGGYSLLRAGGEGAGVTVSETAPPVTNSGSLWFNSSNGALYIYYKDTNGGHWIQPVLNNVAIADTDYTLPIATTSVLGGVRPDGATITISSGVISYVSTGSYNSSQFLGTTTIVHTTEIITTKTAPTGTVVYDYSTENGRYYHTGAVANWTANFTNVPTTNNRSIVFNLAIVQGATGYLPTQLQIDGTVQPINWLDNAVPTAGTVNKVDIVTFILIRTNNTWLVVGSVSHNGA
jgi:hypothetical protein